MRDYTAFKARAVVDWVEVQVTLPGPTQPRHVRRRIERLLPHWGKAPYVHVEAGDGSGPGSTLRFRVQDPLGPAALLRDVQAIARPGDPPPSEDAVRIVGIEVSLDLYHREHDRQALAEMALHLFRHHARPPTQAPGTGPRITEPGHFRFADGGRDSLQALVEGFTINAGTEGADYKARYYVKTSDSINGEVYVELPPAEHRARIEVTLRGAALPFSTLEAWRSFKFESLARTFGMRALLPAQASDSWLAKIPRFGRPVELSKIAAHERSTRPGTRADSAWAHVARNALRVLTRSQAKR